MNFTITQTTPWFKTCFFFLILGGAIWGVSQILSDSNGPSALGDYLGCDWDGAVGLSWENHGKITR